MNCVNNGLLMFVVSNHGDFYWFDRFGNFFLAYLRECLAEVLFFSSHSCFGSLDLLMAGCCVLILFPRNMTQDDRIGPIQSMEFFIFTRLYRGGVCYRTSSLKLFGLVNFITTTCWFRGTGFSCLVMST